MVYAVKDRNGQLTYTADRKEAFFELLDQQGPLFPNPFAGLVFDVGRQMVDAVTKREVIAADEDRARSDVSAALRRSALTVHDLIAIPDTGAVNVALDPADAIDAFLHFSGALSRGISCGVVVDNEPTRRLQGVLDCAVSTLLKFPEGGPRLALENFDVVHAMDQIGPTELRKISSSVVAATEEWIASDSMVQTMTLSIF